MPALPSGLLTHFLDLVPEPFRAEALVGFQHLDMPALKVGAEAIEAERAGVLFADAVTDDVHCPALARMHRGLRDLLQLELPADFAAHLRLLLAAVAGADVAPVRRELFLTAARTPGPIGGLLRFVLTEALWLNVLLATWEDDGRFEALACLDDAGRQAQRIFTEAAADPMFAEEGVRPIELMLVGLLHRMQQSFAQIAPLVATATTEFKVRFELLVETAVRARQMDAQDAAIVRTIAEEIREQMAIGSQQVVDRHPLLFASTDSVEQRRHRLKERGLAGTPKQPPRNRIVDIISEALTDEEVA
jgi:hypothetical protein